MKTVSFCTKESGCFSEITIEELVEIIQAEDYPVKGRTLEEHVSAIRIADHKDQLIEQLPSFTPSGAFRKGKLVGYSQLVMLEYTDVPRDEVIDLRARIENYDFTHLCFLSATGDGLVVLIRVSNDLEAHNEACNQCAVYLEEHAGRKVDHPGSDLAEYCPISHDPDAYYAPKSKVLEVIDGRFFEPVRIVEDDVDYHEASFQYLVQSLAGECLQRGIPMEDVVAFIRGRYVIEADIEALVARIYSPQNKVA